MTQEPRRNGGNPPKAATVSPGDAAVLITGPDPRSRDNGTGFCVAVDGGNATIVTCAHVVRDLGVSIQDLRVNGSPVQTVTTAIDRGIDIALLQVPRFAAPVPRVAWDLPATDTPVFSCGYVHLHGGQFISRRIEGKVTETVQMRSLHSPEGLPTLRVVTATADIEPGTSGAPLWSKDGRVIGVMAFASRSGKEGYALAMAGLRHIIPEPSPGAVAVASQAQTPVRPLPPALGPVTAPDDPQKNRFGGGETDGTVGLIVAYVRSVGSRYFVFNTTVRSLDPGVRLEGPARFFLHDSFPRSVIQITRADADGGFTLSEVHSYGMFTIGCHVFASDGKWHSVEYDLTSAEGIPDDFRNR